MKQISYWAKNHVWQSRLLIILIYTMLNILGIFTGKMLNEINIIIPKLYFIIFTVSIIALWIYYPERGNINSSIKPSYFFRKLFDFSLGAVTFLMIIYVGNKWQNLFIESNTATASFIVPHSKDSAIYNNHLIKNFITTINSNDVNKLTQRQKFRLLKDQIKVIKKDKGTSKAGKTLLIILSVVIAIALLFGLAALSCNIACAGSEGLAWVIAIGGTFLIVFFLARIIKRISRPSAKRNVEVIGMR